MYRAATQAGAIQALFNGQLDKTGYRACPALFRKLFLSIVELLRNNDKTKGETGMARTVATGEDTFETLRTGNLFYVDKTSFIAEW